MDQTGLKSTAALVLIFTLTVFPGAAQAGDSLTLSDALEIALSNNPDVKLAATNLRSAEVKVQSQKSDFLPVLNAGLNAAEMFENGSVNKNYHTAQVDVSARYNLYSGGANTASLQSARKEYSAADLDYRQERQSLLLEVSTFYLNALSSEEILDVMREELENARVQLDKIEAMYEAGSRPVTDLYQQQAAVKEAELSLLTAQRDMEVSRIQLLGILGLDVDPGMMVSDPALQTDTIIHSFPELGELLPLAIAARSDIAAQKERIEAAREDIAEARSGSSVTVDLTGSIGSSYQSISDESTWDQLSDDNLAASIGISLSVPLYDARQTQNAVRQAQLSLTSEEVALTQLKLQAREELGTALQDHETAAKSLEVSEARLQWAEKALESVEARYGTGAANLVELNDARSEAVESRYDVVNARYDYLAKALSTEFYKGSIESAIQVLLEGGEGS